MVGSLSIIVVSVLAGTAPRPLRRLEMSHVRK
jgi:hypothetical protein